MTDSVRITILGEPASKANRRRFGFDYKTGKRISAKSAMAVSYVKMVKAQVRKVEPLLEGDLCFTAVIYYRTHRPDLDPSLILDALQGLVYKNDRQIKEIHVYHGIDKEIPRAEVVIWRCDAQ